MLTIIIILFVVGIFAGVTTLLLMGALAISWLIQPLIEGFYLDKKYPQALALKLIVYALIALALGFTLLEISNTLVNLLEGRTWEEILRSENI